MLNELKPCPFCGGQPFSRVDIINSNTLQFSVTCNNCGTKKIDNFELCDTNFYNVSVVLRENIASWNRRADNE